MGLCGDRQLGYLLRSWYYTIPGGEGLWHSTSLHLQLEAVTPLICILLLRDIVPPHVIAFVDNQASLQALKKGYGRDVSIHGLW